MKVLKRKDVLRMQSKFRMMPLFSKLTFLKVVFHDLKSMICHLRTRPKTSKQIKGGKHTLHNIAGGILPLASHLSLEKAIHWGMSETFGHKMAGNCFRKFGWYLKSSIHGHPNKKKRIRRSEYYCAQLLFSR